MGDLVALAEELGTTDRTLRRAVADGLIRAERPSPRTIELAPAERAYLRRNWIRLSALRRVLRTEPNVEVAVLFGSVARGTDHPESDIDLLVALRDDDALAAAGLEARLEERLGTTVQVTRLAQAETSPALLAEVLRDGRVLVERGTAWKRVQHRARSIQREADATIADAWAELFR